MNRDIKTVCNKTGDLYETNSKPPNSKFYLQRLGFYFFHPKSLLYRLKDEICNEKKSNNDNNNNQHFYELLEKFSKEKQLSNQ